MLGTLLDAVRETVRHSGLLDACDTTGFSVRRTASPDGAFAVSSTAVPALRTAELRGLATSLRGAGYQVRLRRVGREPTLLVRTHDVGLAEETGPGLGEPVEGAGR